MFEIRIHGRAGQGAKTIAQFLAGASLKAGRFVQAFPAYGPARTGAPMNAYIRLNEKPINIYSEIKEPDAVLVIDSLLIEMEDVVSGLKKDGLIIINSSQPADVLKKELIKKGLHPKTRVITLPASEIALKILKKDISNTVLLGALIKATKIVKLNDLLKVVKSQFIKKLGSELTQANLKLIQKGYDLINPKL